jgi:hypothetical protein
MEMIAMLDGLGMNTEYPIGDVDPATSTRYYKEPRPASQPPEPPTGLRPYEPMTSYSLGNLGQDGEEGDFEMEYAADGSPPGGSSVKPEGIPLSGWLVIGGTTLFVLALVQYFRSGGSASAPAMAGADADMMMDGGFSEPEMVTFPTRKRRTRRKGRKSRK